MATGWLGWSPAQALHTPIAQIELALDGLIDWTKRTHPFAAPEPKPKATVADRLKSAFRALGARRPETPHGEY